VIESYLGAIKTGSVAISPATNLFGYKPDSADWQLIAIQMYNFAPSLPTFDTYTISLAGSWTNGIDLGFDDIRYQYSNIITAADVIVNKTDYHLVEAPDGVRTVFSTSSPFVVGTTWLLKNGIRQIPGTDYIEQGGKIVFTKAPSANAGLTCDYKTLGS
jgi:hypothetical protein